MTAITTGSRYKYILKVLDLNFYKRLEGCLLHEMLVWYEAPASAVKACEEFNYEYNISHFHLRI